MKTKRYTIAMLIALVFATINIQAQSARRSATQNKKERAKTSRTVTRETTPQKSKAIQARKPQARTKQSAQVREQQTRTSQSARHTQTPQVRKQQTRSNQAVRHAQTQKVRKPSSMSTTHNPRSTYKKPNNVRTANKRHSAPVKSKNYNNKHYYGGNHYHYAYPTRKVKFHYHHDTYIHHYNVLYYPAYANIYWSRNMYRDYRRWYPDYRWNYNYGYRIHTISAFEAQYNLGEVAMVYGRVYATWYNQETDDFLLLFGGDFPYQQFTVVIPGHVARKFSWRPQRYFLGEHITVTGLITTYDGSPEIVVKNKRQLGIY